MRRLTAVDCRPRWPRASRGLLVGAALLAHLPGNAAAGQGPERVPAASRDTFPHRRHTTVACLVCHLSRTGEKLTFEPPRGCRICHHVEVSRGGCAQCHEPSRLPDSLEVRVAVAAARRPLHQRAVAFPHRRHAGERCEACHAPSVTMAPVDSAVACTGCHEQHHEAGRTCATCHRTPAITRAHARPVRPHVACDGCHPTATIERLLPTRPFCLTCHAQALDHHRERECVTCHLQASPEEYQPRLLKPRPAG